MWSLARLNTCIFCNMVWIRYVKRTDLATWCVRAKWNRARGGRLVRGSLGLWAARDQFSTRLCYGKPFPLSDWLGLQASIALKPIHEHEAGLRT